LKAEERFHPFEGDFRDPFDRDRDRVIHSEWFRGLEYKTQVFINTDGDYFRTRLTHSLEVSQIARTIAKSLGLRESLAEAIALAHDLGHTPFGHVGGDALDEALRALGNEHGFEHNFQSFRVLTKLEKRYANFDGLNLTFATLEGVLKHSAPYKKSFFPAWIDETFELDFHPSPEAIVVDHADTIAYTAADIDDAIKYQLVSFDELCESSLVLECVKSVVDEGLRDKSSQLFRYRLVTLLLTRLIVDFLEHSKGASDLMGVRVAVVESLDMGFGAQMEAKVRELKRLMHKKVYKHERIMRKMFFGKQCVLGLFEALSGENKLLPSSYKQQCDEQNQNRVVADYISSLSDRAATELYRELY
jgi:dGTPase